MRLYRLIVGTALLPRALHVAWVGLTVAGVLLWVIIPGTCSAIVGSNGTASNANGFSLEQTIEAKTRDLASAPYEPPTAEPVCFVSDVQKYCCPSACVVKDSPKWHQANDVLRACMRGIGFSDAESKGATVFTKCSCGKGGKP